jgi:opacity protein-like surface antigen
MPKNTLIAGLLLSTALPLAAQADNSQGWYGAMSLGVSSYGNSQDDEDQLRSELAAQGIQADVHVDDNPAALGIGLGYRFTPSFALEANYLDLGEATAHVHVFSPSDFFLRERLDASGVTLDAIGLMPVSDHVSLFGKLGAFGYTLDDSIDSDVPTGPQPPDAHGTSWDWGLGVQVWITRMVGIRAGYSNYHGVGDENTTGKQNIGLVYGQVYLNF